MTEEQKQLGAVLWDIADELRGGMNASAFQDYMLSLIFLRYLSSNYETIAAQELGDEYPTPQTEEYQQKITANGKTETETVQKEISPLQVWYAQNSADIAAFENLMRRSAQYVVKPDYLWNNIAELSRVQNEKVLETLDAGFTYIETESFDNAFHGLFSEINLQSERLGRDLSERNKKLCEIISKLHQGLKKFSDSVDDLGDAYEYLIEKFAANAGQKAGEFFTPQPVSSILSRIVALDNHNPTSGNREKLDKVLDFACGSGSLLLNVNKQKIKFGIGALYGQEKNPATYNLARMNMILHGVNENRFTIYRGDTLENDWDFLNEPNPAKKPYFDGIVANPPFSLKWKPSNGTGDDVRFKSHGVAPKSAADFAFLLHGLHYLKDDGTMAIILPHGVLFRGGAEARIRKKLLEKDKCIDAIIGLPSNLFYSTGIPVCILVIKKCKKHDDILFIDASTEGNFRKERRQNHLDDIHVKKIVKTYANREKITRYSRRVDMEEIIENDYNLNISRYIDTSPEEIPIDLHEVHEKLAEVERKSKDAIQKHNKYLLDLGLNLLPY